MTPEQETLARLKRLEQAVLQICLDVGHSGDTTLAVLNTPVEHYADETADQAFERFLRSARRRYRGDA